MTASPGRSPMGVVVAEPPRSLATGAERAPAGSWVEISQVVLPARERATNVPRDTGATDFVARIRGFLVESAAIGGDASVRTLLGREVAGRLTAINPRNPADFGDPVPELLALGLAARRALEEPEPR